MLPTSWTNDWKWGGSGSLDSQRTFIKDHVLGITDASGDLLPYPPIHTRMYTWTRTRDNDDTAVAHEHTLDVLQTRQCDAD
jgi:hypothetical protein